MFLFLFFLAKYKIACYCYNHIQHSLVYQHANTCRINDKHKVQLRLKGCKYLSRYLILDRRIWLMKCALMWNNGSFVINCQNSTKKNKNKTKTNKNLCTAHFRGCSVLSITEVPFCAHEVLEKKNTDFKPQKHQNIWIIIMRVRILHIAFCQFLSDFSNHRSLLAIMQLFSMNLLMSKHSRYEH